MPHAEFIEKIIHIFLEELRDKSYRGLHLGTVILAEAEKIVLQKGGKEIILHAQCRVRGFYENSGYEGYGPIGEDEGHPHIWMKKVINQ